MISCHIPNVVISNHLSNLIEMIQDPNIISQISHIVFTNLKFLELCNSSINQAANNITNI